MSNVLHFISKVYPRSEHHPQARVSYRANDRFGLLYLAAVNVDGTRGFALVTDLGDEEAKTLFSYFPDCRVHADHLKNTLQGFADDREHQSSLNSQLATVRNERDNIRAKYEWTRRG